MNPAASIVLAEEAVEILFTADDIYKLIADRIIAFDLYRDDISETHRSLVFRDTASMELHRHLNNAIATQQSSVQQVFNITPGAVILYDGARYTVTFVGDANAIFQCDDRTVEFPLEMLMKLFEAGKITIFGQEQVCESFTSSDILNVLSPQQINSALARTKILDSAESNSSMVPCSTRTIQRWRKKIREAGDTALEKTVALANGQAGRGNRSRKIPIEVADLMDATIGKIYNKTAGGSQRHAYLHFCGECHKLGLTPCSDRTFFGRVKTLSSTRKREGKRKEYQTQKPIIWYLYADEPIHGVRPFQYVHIDHTPLDLLLTYPSEKKSLGKAWCSLAIDADTRHIVGFALSFEPPSYRSCMMVIRDIVRRHHRMPEMIITDNGKEFHSAAFQRVCDLYRTHLRFRPSAQPRHGSVMERVFGTTNTQFIHSLQGNTKLMKHVRTVTKSVNPENFIEWTLPALYGALDYYASVIYGREPHPAHGFGPEAYLCSRLVETGVRRNRWVQFDQILMIETCPGPPGLETRMVDGMRGIKVSHIWYWADEFSQARWQGASVVVRVDPWDIRKVYVLLGNQWHVCVSKLLSKLKHYTTIELRYAYEELSKKRRIGKLSPERCAEWLRLYDAKNFDPRLRMQQSEARYLYDGLRMSDVSHHAYIDEESHPVMHNVLPNQETPSNAVAEVEASSGVMCSNSNFAAKRPAESNDDDEINEYDLY